MTTTNVGNAQPVASALGATQPESAAATVPDFTAEWRQIREDLGREAEGALRIGQTLIEIRDALKPLGLWLSALRQHGMSQPMASRYIRFAELPEDQRATWKRVNWFSLSEAVGEGRPKRSRGPASARADYSSTNSAPAAEIDADELADLRAEVDRRLALAAEIVDANEEALAGRPNPPDPVTLREVGDDVRFVLDAGLEARVAWRLGLRT